MLFITQCFTTIVDDIENFFRINTNFADEIR